MIHIKKEQNIDIDLKKIIINTYFKLTIGVTEKKIITKLCTN